MKWDENLSYKFVALGVALILWLSMLGRKDSTLVREFDLQFIYGPGIEVQGTVPDSVKVEVAGPRVALKKINQINPIFTVDLTTAKPGHQVIHLNKDGLSLPIGSRVLNIDPADVELNLKSNKPELGESK
jgi:hypothetical protein